MTSDPSGVANLKPPAEPENGLRRKESDRLKIMRPVERKSQGRMKTFGGRKDG